MRKAFFVVLLAALGLSVPLTAGAADRSPRQQTFVVLYEHGASADSARAAVKRAGGRVVSENREVGVATVRSANADFATDVAASSAVAGAARNRPVGEVPADRVRDPFAIERMAEQRRSAPGNGHVRHQGAATVT